MPDRTSEPEEYRPEQQDWEEDRGTDEGQAGEEEHGYPVDDALLDHEPDVLLDVPTLKVDEINLEVENLRARVSLQAEVLDLLKLNVGADVALGRVSLGIKGVEAEALLKVRLNNVARILDRVMTTIDENPAILQNLTQGLGSAVEDVGAGSGRAVEGVGEGASAAIEDVGRGAGGAVEDVGAGTGRAVEGIGAAVEDVGRGTGDAVKGVGEGAGAAAEDVGRGAGEAVEDIDDVAEDVGEGGGRAVEEAGRAAGENVQDVGRDGGDAVEGAHTAVNTTGRDAGEDRAGEAETSRQQAKRAARHGQAINRGSQGPSRQGRQVRPRAQ